MYKLKIRCSQLSEFVTKPKSGNGISQGAKSAVRNAVKSDLFGWQSFDGNRYTEKGNQLENDAIKLIGLKRGLPLKKNTERRENECLTGECDIYIPSRKLIIDAKCSYDIGAHPFFEDEAMEKAKKSGYDWQMQGYMWLWDCEEAQIDFCLFPTPLDLIPSWQDPTKFIDLVEQIPQAKRITTVIVKRDEKLIEQITERYAVASEYYNQLVEEHLKR